MVDFRGTMLCFECAATNRQDYSHQGNVSQLTNDEKCQALCINVESAKVACENYADAYRLIARQLVEAAERCLPDSWLARAGLGFINSEIPGALLGGLLARWAAHHENTVLVIDEIDSLVGDSLVSVLSQIRTGHANRPHAFPMSVILCGVRYVRDYRIKIR